MPGAALVALAVDLLVGEPPAAVHPTVWMGRWVAAGRGRRRSRTPASSFAEGALLTGSGVMLAAAAARLCDRALARVPPRHTGWLAGLALKPALALRALLHAAGAVQRSLAHDRLDEARALLGRHLVSRDTRTLSASDVAGAVIESVAENLNDSVIAPLLAFRAGGLALAYAWRMINTADAMLGYRTEELEWFGKCAARSDDAAAFVPARCTAFLIACAAPCGPGSPRRALARAWRDAGNTPSPNSGWPMAAMAGALDVRLVKHGCYVLNAGAGDPGPADIARACRIVAAAAVAAALAVDLS